jgi:zinc protease
MTWVALGAAVVVPGAASAQAPSGPKSDAKAEAPPKADDSSKIAFTKSTLPNGLRVILHEDHAVPTVVVNLSYRVGSRFEQSKRTGFAHLFEHLMFMGTRRAPTKAFDAWMEASGGWNNAWTSEDRTDYYDVGPPTSLELLLWLEADRLSDLGPSMTLEKLNAQREVVRNERRQTSENQPYGKAELRLPELLFPEGHPYHHPVIGSHEDLEAASVDDVKAFFATHYIAKNASLVVAGDFDPAKTMPLVEKLFGGLPGTARAADPGLPSGVPALSTVVRETQKDDVELARVSFAWPSPKHFAKGDAELDLLSSALTATKASRLTERLVWKDKLAQKVDAYQASGALGSRFVIDVLVRPGVDPAKIEPAILAELEKLRKEPLPEAELARAKNGFETALFTRLESVRERASLLNAYEEETGDPGYLPKDLARYRTATAEDLRSTAKDVLKPEARVVLTVLPKRAPEPPAPAPKAGKKADPTPKKATPKGGAK